jgi:hypothetical protein
MNLATACVNTGSVVLASLRPLLGCWGCSRCRKVIERYFRSHLAEPDAERAIFALRAAILNWQELNNG